jgi:hypothetical protein
MEGARPHFDLAGLLIVLRQSVGSIFKFLTDQIEYLVALFFLVFLAGASSCLPRLRRQWFLWLPPLLACVAYSLVLIEGRYIAPFLLLLWLAAFSLAVSSASLLTSRNALALVLAIVSVTALRVTKFTADNLMIAAGKQENIDYNVARGLQALGIAPGDRAATLARMAEVHWARMAEIKIVAEIPLGEESAFWNASPPEKLNVFRVLAGTGAKILIAKDPPAFATREGWTPVGGTGFYVHRLTPMAAAGAPEDRSH